MLDDLHTKRLSAYEKVEMCERIRAQVRCGLVVVIGFLR
jgi:hypothetical protein